MGSPSVPGAPRVPAGGHARARRALREHHASPPGDSRGLAERPGSATRSCRGTRLPNRRVESKARTGAASVGRPGALYRATLRTLVPRKQEGPKGTPNRRQAREDKGDPVSHITDKCNSNLGKI